MTQKTVLIKRMEERDEKARVIHVIEIHRTHFPSTHQYEKRFNEPIPKSAKILPRYKKVKLDLGAIRTEEEIAIIGSSIIFLGATGNFGIKIGSRNSDTLDQDDFSIGIPLTIPFKTVYITNETQVGKNVRFLIL